VLRRKEKGTTKDKGVTLRVYKGERKIYEGGWGLVDSLPSSEFSKDGKIRRQGKGGGGQKNFKGDLDTKEKK